MTDSWLNRLCNVHRLGTFQAAKRWHGRSGRAVDMVDGPQNSAMAEAMKTAAAKVAVVQKGCTSPLPMWATKYILDHGTAAYRNLMADTVKWDDRLRKAPAVVPKEFADGPTQQAFEAVYKGGGVKWSRRQSKKSKAENTSAFSKTMSPSLGHRAGVPVMRVVVFI